MTDKTGKIGFKLQFNNDINSAYKIKYKTKVKDRVYGAEQIFNTVTRDTYKGEANQYTTQRILNKQNVDTGKDKDVDYLNKTVKWTVKVNEDKRTMTNLILTDTFGNAGLKLIGKPIISPSPGVEGTDYIITKVGTEDFSKGDGFKIEFKNPINEAYTITYTTKFDFYKLIDGMKEFSNTASITWDENKTNKPLTSTKTFDPREEVKNNGKKTGSYDVNTKQLTWTVGANYNKRVLAAGATLVDTIPVGQKATSVTAVVYKMGYEEDGEHSKGAIIDASKYDLTVTDKQLTVKFKDEVDYAFYVVFSTEFIGSDVNQGTVTNKATLYDKDNKAVSEPLEVTVTVPKGGEYVAKDFTRDKDDQTLLNWKVVINANQSIVKNVKLVDNPSTNQVLLPDSFHLYVTTVNQSGKQ